MLDGLHQEPRGAVVVPELEFDSGDERKQVRLGGGRSRGPDPGAKSLRLLESELHLSLLQDGADAVDLRVVLGIERSAYVSNGDRDGDGARPTRVGGDGVGLASDLRKPLPVEPANRGDEVPEVRPEDTRVLANFALDVLPRKDMYREQSLRFVLLGDQARDFLDRSVTGA